MQITEMTKTFSSWPELAGLIYVPHSEEEYQRLNTTYAGPTANLADFGPLRFID